MHVEVAYGHGEVVELLQAQVALGRTFKLGSGHSIYDYTALFSPFLEVKILKGHYYNQKKARPHSRSGPLN